MKKIIKVKNLKVSILEINSAKFISLTDIAKKKNFNEPRFIIRNWLRNRNTIEFLGLWESIYNTNFNRAEFDTVRFNVGLNSFTISPSFWIKKTNAIGIITKTGRYNSGTYAHEDIALEFASWISPEFKLFLIKEFRRLKELENKNSDWNIKRTLTKINYRIHTNAIKENLIPEKIILDKVKEIYSSEADVLNLALFGMTSKEWKEKNNFEGNMRDNVNVVQLVCLSNLENLNAHFISEGIAQKERLVKLNEIAIEQMKLLVLGREMKRLK